MNETDECISPEQGRAAPVLRIVSMFHICLTVVVILSGVILWHRNRSKVFLQRRNPFLVVLIIIPLLSNVITGSVYRWCLNMDDVKIAGCFAGNFFFALIAPSFVIPYLVRIINFHYRVALNSKLALLQERRIKETRERKNTLIATKKTSNLGIPTQKTLVQNGPPENPVMFKNTSFLPDPENSMASATTDMKEFKEVRNLKYKAGSNFSIELAISLLLTSICLSLLYASLSCPVKFLGTTECEFGFITSGAVTIIIVPFLILLGFYFYFLYLTKKAPDLFAIKREITVVFRLAWLAFFFIILGLIDVGNVAKYDSEETIKFKWVQMLDFVLLAMFIHSVHVQVLYAHRFEKSSRGLVSVSLREILDHPEGTKLFETFLQSDFSVENIKVYLLMKRWRDSYIESSSHRRETEAKNIFRYWFDMKNPDAVGINCSHQAYLNLGTEIEETSNYKKSLFDNMLAEIFSLMEQDSFTRFVRTEEYKVFVGLQDPVVDDSDFEDHAL